MTEQEKKIYEHLVQIARLAYPSFMVDVKNISELVIKRDALVKQLAKTIHDVQS